MQCPHWNYIHCLWPPPLHPRLSEQGWGLLLLPHWHPGASCRLAWDRGPPVLPAFPFLSPVLATASARWGVESLPGPSASLPNLWTVCPRLGKGMGGRKLSSPHLAGLAVTHDHPLPLPPLLGFPNFFCKARSPPLPYHGCCIPPARPRGDFQLCPNPKLSTGQDPGPSSGEPHGQGAQVGRELYPRLGMGS